MFIDVDFSETDFTGANLLETAFVNVNMAGAVGLDAVTHSGPSYIDLATLARSDASLPKPFLEGAGLLQFLSTQRQYRSCFISFTEADNAFAEKLYQTLGSHGVNCWRWKEDAEWGASLRTSIADAITVYDRVLVVFSENSLRSEPTLVEIRRGLRREADHRRGSQPGDVIYPIILDRAIFEWRDALRDEILEKACADFQGWSDETRYQLSFSRLLSSLSK
jgi:hypothetical protein